ncbi:MAG: T9SS type A sorting domain-containing protein [Janthinobacterium lividum]
MLYVDIMQKFLSTHNPSFYLLLQRVLLNGKAGLLTGLTLFMLVGFANSTKAGGFATNFAIINSTPYSTNGNPGSFQNRNFGTFNRTGSNLDVLALSAEANIVADAGDDVQSAQLLYRVFRQDNLDDLGGFVPLPLQQTTVNGNNLKWTNTGTQPNLVSFASTPGTYTVQVQFQTTIANNGIISVVSDDNNGDFYTATFTVTVNNSLYQPSTWNNNSGDTNWFNRANWSANRVPDSNTDVVVPFDSDNDDGVELLYPIISGGGEAQVHNLILQGESSTEGAKLNVASTTLSITGNFQDIYGGLINSKATLSFIGRDQVIDATETLYRVVINGGGTKSLTGLLNIQDKLSFGSNGGLLVTSTRNAETFRVNLQPSALIEGESEIGYVLGALRSTQTINVGGTSKFGGIGVELTATSGNPGITIATRKSAIYKVGKAVSIRRSFSFTADNSSLQDFSLIFSYLNADLNNIKPADLTLFRSLSGSAPFQPLYKDSNSPSDKILTKANITGALAATFVLGDATNPLPVTLTSFAAVAQGPNALLTWTTAQELNNAGFEVQVSTDGTTFSKLGFVAAASPNSTQARTYQYRDVTANKQGIRYYRLRQLDVDGKESLFSPQSLTFGGVLATSVQGYPNPFASEINLALQTVTAGQATVSVLDGVGRQVRSWQPTLAAGASNMVLSDLGSLPHGLYVVQVRYNDGQTQRLKVVKE